MQVTKRTFLKGLLATAAAGGVVSQASAKPQADLPAKWDREADVVILGYGGAGASAAITAKDAGADVVIFEKTAQGGGNTAVSSGGMIFRITVNALLLTLQRLTTLPTLRKTRNCWKLSLTKR